MASPLTLPRTRSVQTCAVLLLILILLGACSTWLPAVHREVSNPWPDFAAVKRSFDHITPFQTSMDQVRALGFDPDKTPNVQMLNQAQVIEAVLPSPLQERSTVPPGVLQCMQVGSACVAYAMTPSRIEQRRVGNFVLDFFNFHRQIVTTGWKFSALIVVIDQQVVYTQWSGEPQIHTTIDRNIPLGPLQNFDESLGIGM
jgi:hypothetical protein